MIVVLLYIKIMFTYKSISLELFVKIPMDSLNPVSRILTDCEAASYDVSRGWSRGRVTGRQTVNKQFHYIYQIMKGQR